MTPLLAAFALALVFYILGVYLFVAATRYAYDLPRWVCFLWPLVVAVGLIAGGREGVVRTVDAWEPRRAGEARR